MKPTEKATETQVREKQETPALPALSLFVKWTIILCRVKIHSAYLLTHNSELILFIVMFTWIVKNLIFLKNIFY
jgi:hypothetical protein